MRTIDNESLLSTIIIFTTTHEKNPIIQTPIAGSCHRSARRSPGTGRAGQPRASDSDTARRQHTHRRAARRRVLQLQHHCRRLHHRQERGRLLRLRPAPGRHPQGQHTSGPRRCTAQCRRDVVPERSEQVCHRQPGGSPGQGPACETRQPAPEDARCRLLQVPRPHHPGQLQRPHLHPRRRPAVLHTHVQRGKLLGLHQRGRLLQQLWQPVSGQCARLLLQEQQRQVHPAIRRGGPRHGQLLVHGRPQLLEQRVSRGHESARRHGRLQQV